MVRRLFRATDTSSHCGLPIVVACIALAAITALLQAYTLYFLPLGAPGGVAVLGVIASFTGLRLLTMLYIIAASFIQIPIFVVIGFVTYALASYDNECRWCRYNKLIPCTQTDYVSWLCGLDNGLLWSAISVAFFACLFVGTTLQSYRKLRLHQAGVGTVVQRGRRARHDSCHHHHEQVIVSPTVYTVPTNTTVTGPSAPPTIFVQQQTPGIYPSMPPPAYNVATSQPIITISSAQQMNFNPPRNPDF